MSAEELAAVAFCGHRYVISVSNNIRLTVVPPFIPLAPFQIALQAQLIWFRVGGD